MDQNELLRRLAAQAGGDAALERLSGALGTADGRRAVEQLLSLIHISNTGRN